MTAAAARVLKTLMALVDGKPVCVIIPFDPRGLDSHSAASRRR
jgi:prolyl-tRNA editing enzyme YbaK/EbsC (Cys-tRNA(Pro) deacylase)